MKLPVNFSGVGEFKPLPEGMYLVSVQNIEQKTSTAGYPYLNWQFKVIDGEHQNQMLWFITSLKDDALWNLFNVLKAFGVKVQKKQMNLDTKNLIGKVAQAVVHNETYEGQIQNRVTKLLPPPDGVGGMDDLP